MSAARKGTDMSAASLSATGNDRINPGGNLSLAFLLECFRVDAHAGTLFWRARPREHFRTDRSWRAWNSRYAGTKAGQTRKDGYTSVRVGGRSLLLHRVIYAIVNSMDMQDVPATIDHRDNDQTNNCPDNLRGALHAQNSANVGKHANNTSGYKGVNRYRPNARWEARIRAGGKRIHLGYFDTPEEAHAAYQAAAISLHGDFARAS